MNTVRQNEVGVPSFTSFFRPVLNLIVADFADVERIVQDCLDAIGGEGFSLLGMEPRFIESSCDCL
ncbi:hypothetical protein D3C76_1317230 [compost metagenome]